MLKLLVHGANGHMGRILCGLIEADPAYTLVGRIDASGGENCLGSLSEFTGDADMLVDFSHHSATQTLLNWAIARSIPVVLATTGQTDEEKSLIRSAAQQIPIFFSANMSPAVALLADMAAQAVRMFPKADVEIVERHHHRKLDVPSGTALMLARAIQAERPDSTLNVGRHENGRRNANEIGIHSLRMGNEVGTHEIIIDTGTERLTLTHQAHDRALFAEGALKAADFLADKPAGLYDMQALLNDQNR